MAFDDFYPEGHQGGISFIMNGKRVATNGWFVLRSEIPAGATAGAVKWYIEPNVVEGWRYKPVIQTSQVVYHPQQPKRAIIETDRRTEPLKTATLVKYGPEGETAVREIGIDTWDGSFLHYRYLIADFSDITEEGLYCVRYGDTVRCSVPPEHLGCRTGYLVFRIQTLLPREELSGHLRP